MRVLDLDMDYFMDLIANTPESVQTRLSENTMERQYGVSQRFVSFSKIT